MSGSHVVGGNQLRAIVERIENIEEEIRELRKPRRKFIWKRKEMASTSRFFEK